MTWIKKLPEPGSRYANTFFEKSSEKNNTNHMSTMRHAHWIIKIPPNFNIKKTLRNTKFKHKRNIVTFEKRSLYILFNIRNRQ